MTDTFSRDVQRIQLRRLFSDTGALADQCNALIARVDPQIADRPAGVYETYVRALKAREGAVAAIERIRSAPAAETDYRVAVRDIAWSAMKLQDALTALRAIEHVTFPGEASEIAFEDEVFIPADLYHAESVAEAEAKRDAAPAGGHPALVTLIVAAVLALGLAILGVFGRGAQTGIVEVGVGGLFLLLIGWLIVMIARRGSVIFWL